MLHRFAHDSFDAECRAAGFSEQHGGDFLGRSFFKNILCVFGGHGQQIACLILAEGKCMRRLTAESCDELAKLPMDTRMESLNVSNAAAIALYHFFAGQHG